MKGKDLRIGSTIWILDDKKIKSVKVKKLEDFNEAKIKVHIGQQGYILMPKESSKVLDVNNITFFLNRKDILPKLIKRQKERIKQKKMELQLAEYYLVDLQEELKNK